MFPTSNSMYRLRPQPGSGATPFDVPARPGGLATPSPVPPRPGQEPRPHGSNVMNFMNRLGNVAGRAEQMGYLDPGQVPGWLLQGNLPPGGMTDDWRNRLSGWKDQLQGWGAGGESLPVERPVSFAKGGAVDYASKVRSILEQRSGNQNFPRMSGEIHGGSGNADDVPAMLEGASKPGEAPEFVLNKGAVLNLGLDFLNSQNQRGLASLQAPSAPPQGGIQEMKKGGKADRSGGIEFPPAGDYPDLAYSEGLTGFPNQYGWGSFGGTGASSMYPTYWGSGYPHGMSTSGWYGRSEGRDLGYAQPQGGSYSTGYGLAMSSAWGVPGGGTFMAPGSFNTSSDYVRQLNK